MKFHGKGAGMGEIHISAVMPLLLKCLHSVGSLGALGYALVWHTRDYLHNHKRRCPAERLAAVQSTMEEAAEPNNGLVWE